MLFFLLALIVCKKNYYCRKLYNHASPTCCLFFRESPTSLLAWILRKSPNLSVCNRSITGTKMWSSPTYLNNQPSSPRSQSVDFWRPSSSELGILKISKSIFKIFKKIFTKSMVTYMYFAGTC